MAKISLPAQPGILDGVPRASAYLLLSRKAGVKPAAVRRSLKSLAAHVDGDRAVLGVSAILMQSLGVQVPGLRAFPVLPAAKVDLPVTQSDVLVWVRGGDAGEVFHEVRRLQRLVESAFETDQVWNAFRHKKGNDLTGFEDGTENPKGRAASVAALVADGPLAGSSYVAVQPWVHEFGHFDAMGERARNEVIGRNLETNEELSDAPPTAHVKRTAQESFEPEAFVLRRSMPWVDERRGGLMFVAFGRSFDAYEAQLKRMSGAEDGMVDALFTVSRPIGGGYYWCPPMAIATTPGGGVQLPI